MLLNHGVIGNGRLLALVNPDTSIDWLCMPRFDSPSVFARLLDDEKGGRSRSKPRACGRRWPTRATPTCCAPKSKPPMAGSRSTTSRRACPPGLTVEAPLEIHRLIRPLAGVAARPRAVSTRARLRRASRPSSSPIGAGLEIRGGPTRLFLRSNIPPDYIESGFPVRIDRPIYFVLSCGRPTEVDSTAAVDRALELTVAGWRQWAKSCALPTFAPEAVLRSALCLKLHAFSDTGAIIAAATTSMPEALDSVRTWDYRFCWLRDAAFVVEALRRLSHFAEGEAFVRFLRDVADAGPVAAALRHRRRARPRSKRLLPHLSGFEGVGPVRDRQRRLHAESARPDGRADSLPRNHPHRPARRLRGSHR